MIETFTRYQEIEPMRVLPALLAVTLAAFSLPALAQGNPSADSIINMLRPTGPMTGGTRGIRPAAPSMPGTPSAPATSQAPGAAPQVTAAQPPQAPPSVNLTVQFMTGSAELTPEAMRTLDELGRALSSTTLSAYRFRIEGHTDTVGSGDLNMSLSKARAAKVAEYLEGKFAVSAQRLEPVGRGSQAPLIRTADQVNEPRNRRVQVINLGS
jgi:OOP family OmpA-OmpF porin